MAVIRSLYAMITLKSSRRENGFKKEPVGIYVFVKDSWRVMQPIQPLGPPFSLSLKTGDDAL